jgi:putative ABC transport system permease protein
MREGVELESAAAELQTLMTRLAADHPASNATLGARVIRMGQLDDEQAGPAIYVPLAAVGLVLLLACANVANLLLAKGISRGRELATRAALGASRSRILRQLLVESLVLAAAGAIAGIALAHLALDALRAALPDLIRTTLPNVEELGIDETTLTFAIGIMVLTSLGFGMLPAWRASRQRSAGAVNEGARGTATRATQRLRTALVVGEIALATVLVATALLVTRSYAAMTSVRPGFDADGILTMTASLAEDRYPTAERRQRFFEAVTERMATLPGVRSAAAVNVLPFSTYDRGTSFVIDGQSVPAPGHEPSAAFRVVTPGYFSTLGIPLVAGRSFESADRAGGAPVSIVNRTFAVRHFDGVDPVGRRIRLGDGPWLTIVGVVGDVHHSHVSQAPAPEVYVPLRQSGPPMMMFAIGTDGRVEHLVEPARAAVLQIDPLQPVFHVKPMTQLIADALLPQQVMTALVGIFGIIALLLATIGIYGLVSYTVTQQMPEFGVRLALGATPGALKRLVLRRCAVIVAAGTLLGTGAALLVSGALASFLYGVEAADPSTYIVAAGGLSLLGLCAGIVPAWRSSGAEPLDALRRE